MTNRDINAHHAGSPDAPCDHARQLLPAYVTAEALGQPPQTAYPDVVAHLEQCHACRAELDELRELTGMAYAGQIQPATVYPAPDLSFLPARAAPVSASQQPWRFDELGRLIIAFSQTLLESLRPPLLAGAARGQLLYSYVLEPRPLPDLDVSIDVLAEEPGRGLGFVRVTIEALDQEPLDQLPRAVVLRADGMTRQGQTNETGCVAFDAVPLAALPGLTIEIAPDAE